MYKELTIIVMYLHFSLSHGRKPGIFLDCSLGHIHMHTDNRIFLPWESSRIHNMHNTDLHFSFGHGRK